MGIAQEKKIWVLSELYYPEDSATGYYITKISEALASRYRVGVLSVQPTYKARGTRASVDEFHNNVQIHRCAATTLDKNILAFRFLNLCTISLSIFFNAVKRIGRNDIVFVVTNPPTLPFIAFLACKLRGARLILRIDDVYPEALVAAGIFSPNSVIVKMLRFLHSRLYGRVDRIIVLGRDVRSLVMSRFVAGAPNITIIPTWADIEQVKPLPRSENILLNRDLCGIKEKFIVQYSGNMGRTHNVEAIVNAAAALGKHDTIHFLFITEGAKKKWLMEKVKTESLNNITILPPRPRQEIRDSLNACDIAIISFVAGMAGVSVPSRMYNVMASGKPLIAVGDPQSELALVIEEENIGWVVSPRDAGSLDKVILGAASDPSLLEQMGRRARQAAEGRYSFATIMALYFSAIDGISRRVD